LKKYKLPLNNINLVLNGVELLLVNVYSVQMTAERCKLGLKNKNYSWTI